MIAKTFEVRDRATFIPVLAVKLQPTNEQDRYLLARSGYGRTAGEQSNYVILWGLTGGLATYDPHAWDNRTRQVAHRYIQEKFDFLVSGGVVDVEFLLGETEVPKFSEAETT